MQEIAKELKIQIEYICYSQVHKAVSDLYRVAASTDTTFYFSLGVNTWEVSAAYVLNFEKNLVETLIRPLAFVDSITYVQSGEHQEVVVVRLTANEVL